MYMYLCFNFSSYEDLKDLFLFSRLAAAAENLKKAEGPKKLYVGSLHYNITEDMLQGIFSPFGNVERVSIMRDTATNVSRGYAFVEVCTLVYLYYVLVLYNCISTCTCS